MWFLRSLLQNRQGPRSQPACDECVHVSLTSSRNRSWFVWPPLFVCLLQPCYTFPVQTASPLRTPEYAARMVFIAEASRRTRVAQRTNQVKRSSGCQDDPSPTLQLFTHDRLPSTAADWRAERAFNLRGEERNETETGGRGSEQEQCAQEPVDGARPPRWAARRCADHRAGAGAAVRLLRRCPLYLWRWSRESIVEKHQVCNVHPRLTSAARATRNLGANK